MPTRSRLTCAVLACVLSGCGLKGPLYLPGQASEIVTRPAQVPPQTTGSPNSPQTVDSPPAGDTPAPEVTAPATGETGAGTEEARDGADDPKDPDKKEKGAAPSAR